MLENDLGAVLLTNLAPPSLADSAAPVIAADFAAVYQTHFRFVWRMLARLGVPEAARDDVLQEVFLVVHRKLASYDPRLPMTRWLFGIARRLASRSARTERRVRRRVDVFQPPTSPPQPDEHLTHAQAAAFVKSFLDTLPEAHRAIFALDMEGWSAPEIGATLDVKVGTVYSRLHGIRAELARVLANWEGRRE